MPLNIEASQRKANPVRLRVQWSDTWTSEHDRALAELPEMPRCSHDLFRKLALNPASVRKRFAIVTSGSQPVAVIALRLQTGDWQLITDSAVPWCLFPAIEHFRVAALQSLGIRVVSLQETDVSSLGFTCYPYAIYKADLKSDFERHWRNTGYHKTVRKARNQTPDIEVRIDQSDDLKAVIKFWRETWKDHPEEQTEAAEDVELANLELLQAGEVHVIALALAGRTVGGQILYVHNNDVVEQTHGWDRSLSDLRIGTRIRDAAFQWSAQSGFDHYDLGGGYSYKAEWAPEAGVRYGVAYEPRQRGLVATGKRFGRALAGFSRRNRNH
jgi:hypothetical protein